MPKKFKENNRSVQFPFSAITENSKEYIGIYDKDLKLIRDDAGSAKASCSSEISAAGTQAKR